MPPNYSRWLPTGQAARLLGIGPTYLRLLANQGKLECVPTPLGRLFSPASLEAWAERRAARKAKAAATNKA